MNIKLDIETLFSDGTFISRCCPGEQFGAVMAVPIDESKYAALGFDADGKVIARGEFTAPNCTGMISVSMEYLEDAVIGLTDSDNLRR